MNDSEKIAKRRASQREWYARNRVVHLARTSKWYRSNPRAVRDRHLRRTYGISLGEYEEILSAQGGGCALCGKTQSSEKLRLAVDHDHDTGHIRGILCHHCNQALGALGDSVQSLLRAVEYLRRGERPVGRPSVRINLMKEDSHVAA